MTIHFNKLEQILQNQGKTYYSLRKDGVVGTATAQKLQGRKQGHIDTRTIDSLCKYLDCQPGDFMTYDKD